MKTVRPEVTGRTVAAPVASIDPAELIAATAAANLLHVQPATLTCWRYEKRGPRFVKVGRFVHYRRADLSEWLAAQLHEPNAA
jgi:predicted DNA-binding transcriptional regulator AlpA